MKEHRHRSYGCYAGDSRPNNNSKRGSGGGGGSSSEETDSDFSDEEDEDYSSEADDAESEGPSWDELEKRAYEDDRTAAQKRHQQNDEKDRGRRTGGRR